MRTLPGRPVWITDARGLETDLDREGFVLVRHVSAVADFDLIQEDPAVDQQYIDEMTELLARVTGAAQVFMLGGGKKRYGESATDKLAPLHERQAGPVSARRQHRRFGGRSWSSSSRRSSTTSTSPTTRGGRSTTCGARSRRRRRTSRSRCATRARSHPPTRSRSPPSPRIAASATSSRHHRVPLQPRPPLVLLPRHDARRGPHLQGARHRPAPRRPRRRTPRSPTRPARRARRRGRASRCAGSRCSTDDRDSRRTTTWH